MIHVVTTTVLMYCSITFLVPSINPLTGHAAQRSLFMRLRGRLTWQTRSQRLGTQLFPNSSFPPLFGFLCFRRLATCERLACVNLCAMPLRNASEELRPGWRRVNRSLAAFAVEHPRLRKMAARDLANSWRTGAPTNSACVCPPHVAVVSVRTLCLSFAIRQLLIKPRNGLGQQGQLDSVLFWVRVSQCAEVTHAQLSRKVPKALFFPPLVTSARPNNSKGGRSEEERVSASQGWRVVEGGKGAG